jgi:hypothetical protein
LGKTGLQVSVLGLGAADIGFKHATSRTVARLLASAIDTGVNVIDTAECYGDSEEQIGRALPSRRDYHLFTKCGHASGFGPPDWTPGVLEQTIERSLRRLRTDHLDLLQLHSCSERILREGDVIAVLQRAKAAGKTRNIGYSGDGEAATYAIESGAFDALQVSISVLDQDAIDRLLPLARARQMGVLVKRPFARVAWRLGKRIGRKARRLVGRLPRLHGRYVGHLDDAYLERLDALDYEFLKDGGESVATALRFTIGVDGVHTALVGSIKPERWPQNAGIAARGPLDEAVFEAIRARWRSVAKPSWTQH